MASKLGCIAQLASEISANAAILDEHIRSNNLPQPSFDVDAPEEIEIPSTEEHIVRARNRLQDAAQSLNMLLTPPRERFRYMPANDILMPSILRTLIQTGVVHAIPLDVDMDISIDKLAAKTKFPNTSLLARFIHLCVMNHFFKEPREGYVAHNLHSKILAVEDVWNDWLWCHSEEDMNASASISSCLLKYPSVDRPDQSPFALAHGDDFWTYIEKYPEKGKAFARLMTTALDHDIREAIAKNYSFDDCPNGLVDVGGGKGQIAVTIAQHHPNLKIQLHDLEVVREEAIDFVAKSGKQDQISYVVHDMFQPFPPELCGKSLYMLCNILHDWPDSSCCTLLQNVVAAIGDGGGRILLGEFMMPPYDTIPRHQELLLAAMDVAMFLLYNGANKTSRDWEALCQKADPRLKATKLVGPPTIRMFSLLELVIEPAGAK